MSLESKFSSIRRKTRVNSLGQQRGRLLFVFINKRNVLYTFSTECTLSCGQLLNATTIWQPLMTIKHDSFTFLHKWCLTILFYFRYCITESFGSSRHGYLIRLIPGLILHKNNAKKYFFFKTLTFAILHALIHKNLKNESFLSSLTISY